MASRVKEILVNGASDSKLREMVEGKPGPWLTVNDPVDVDIFFDGVFVVEDIYIQFWALSFPDKIVCFLDGEVERQNSSWISLGKPDSISRGVDMEVAYSGIKREAYRIRLSLSGGQADRFYHRYMIGVKELRLTVSERAVPIVSEPVPSAGAQEEIDTKKELAIRHDRLFLFPQFPQVLQALYQTSKSPWRILSLKSRHAERMLERGLCEEFVGKHVLRPYTSPCGTSVPSRTDMLELLGRYSG